MHQGSRRAFLRGAVLATAVIAVPGTAGAADALSLRAGPTRLRRGVFLPHVGTSFVLTAADGTRVRAVLLEVDDLMRSRGHETRFGLTFRVVGRARPGDGTYVVRHPRLRAFDLYAGAVGPAAAGVLEAVVNV